MQETFGQRLARLRKAKGLTQEDIANKINISPQAVSKWENDISTPDIYVLAELADILGVSVDELLGREEVKEETKENTESEKVDSEVVDDDEKYGNDEKEHVHIGPDGIHVVDKDTQVDIDSSGIHVNDRGDKTNVKFHCHNKENNILQGVLWGLATTAFILLGVLWTDDHFGWKIGWICFLIPIIISTAVSAVRKRRFTHFAYPILVTAAYCSLGLFGTYFGFEGWSFYWFLFITIPAYYFIFGPIDSLIHRKSVTITTNGNTDDESDEDDD